ncbi:hypothetical protein [Mucilaginibacter aquariorum]|uniref:YubB ferredoxin-like domain-containing protein n=1 Tax=Mucilaginibacter aquariorum TaxID=2967225 RepID=A0ABT1T107_9SPHI|nr:hypothetical protein [Mucilaginibacter aquariorum]MCQ6957668.1 hypothetical protein [Mucilaginibacter aquariorum]
MANYCSNSVVFSANETTLEKIRALFEEIELKQHEHGRYYLPDFIKKEGGYMRDIIVNKSRISFETRWVPNTETLMEIADFYQADFTSRYNEIAMGIYGETRYDRNSLIMVTLDSEDFRAIRYDKQKNGYPCGEQVFEYEGDLLDYMLDQKILINQVNRYTVQRD